MKEVVSVPKAVVSLSNLNSSIRSGCERGESVEVRLSMHPVVKLPNILGSDPDSVLGLLP